MKKRAILPLLLALSLLLSLFSCGTADPSPKSRTYYDYFDTPILLSDYSGRSTADFSSLAARIESEFSRYHKLYDIYNEYDGIVNIATLNKHAGKGALKVSRELFDLIKFGKRAYELTGGEVNIAMGAVLSRWHDCRTLALETGKTTLPSEGELKELYSHSNIDEVILDEQALTVELRDERMSLDVGAVAKGYATEQIAKMLESEGVTSCAPRLAHIAESSARMCEFAATPPARMSLSEPVLSSAAADFFDTALTIARV
jgi:thiamine biosynthesis lipoprotein